MESNDSKKTLSGGQGVQQLHLSLIKSQPDTDNSFILLTDDNSVQKSNIKDEKAVNGAERDNEVEDDASPSSNSMAGPFNPLQYDTTIDNRLPKTVTLLTTPDGGKVYLVGTAHFSEESNNDVGMIIQAVQPHIVMVELCESRVHVLQLDEETIFEEAKNLNMQKVGNIIAQNGVFNGLVYMLLLNMSVHITKQLGMAPGGEFRRAFTEAKKIPNCLVHLGDRPINITLKRAIHSLTWWQTITLFWTVIRCKEPITKEDVENSKNRDFLDELLADMAAKYPAIGESFVNERDLYLTHSLQLAARPFQLPQGGAMPARVVGVVGIGHMPGIIRNWGKIESSDITPLMIIPPKSLSTKIVRITIKASLIGALIYIGYKVIPLPSETTIQSLKSSVEGLLKVSANR